jgi:hypothetical protein
VADFDHDRFLDRVVRSEDQLARIGFGTTKQGRALARRYQRWARYRPPQARLERPTGREEMKESPFEFGNQVLSTHHLVRLLRSVFEYLATTDDQIEMLSWLRCSAGSLSIASLIASSICRRALMRMRGDNFRRVARISLTGPVIILAMRTSSSSTESTSVGWGLVAGCTRPFGFGDVGFCTRG